MSSASLKKKFWPKPKSKSVGLFTDLNLYYDALKLCKSLGIINLNVLQKEISERVIGIKYVEQLKKRAFVDLIRELNEFKFIKPKGVSNNSIYEITEQGIELLVIYESNRKRYRRILAAKMQEVYSVPGWFVERLWKINPSGQGQVVIPTPIKGWKPKSYKNENYVWNKELESQVIQSYEKVNTLVPYSFPVNLQEWILTVREEYERLGSVKSRNSTSDNKKAKKKSIQSFAPRKRLSMAMRISALNMLFDNEYNSERDFKNIDPVLKERGFMAWCPRLEALEMVFYSDYYRDLPGRLLFPLTIFKEKVTLSYEVNNDIKSPTAASLQYYQPNWADIKVKFIRVLSNAYQTFHNKEKILYVPLQDVRDEVCRILRISAILFDSFLEQAFKESLTKKIDCSIALETDIREDQRSGSQIHRRPVYIQSIPHSLIAIKMN